MAASWGAVQGRPGKPWAVTVAAHASGLISGIGELDRLLGPKPSLTAAGSYDRGAIAVNKAELLGAATHATTAGLIGRDGALKLALNWTATGPFEIGPLEIAGKASGNGDIGGTLAQPRADLLADFDRIDAPDLVLKQAHIVLSLVRATDGVDGQIAVAAGGDYGPAHAKSAFRLVRDGVALSGIEAAAAGPRRRARSA